MGLPMRNYRLVLCLFSTAWVLGCSTGQRPPPYAEFGAGATKGSTDGGRSDDCSTPGTAGCACSVAGETAACGRIEFVSGDYVTCAMGTSRCDGTQWSTCTGNRLVAQSLRGRTLTGSGMRLMATTSGCNNPCDPSCTKLTGETSDVDAGGLSFEDAGISITPVNAIGPGSGPCNGLWCQVDSCPGQPKTSLSGTVYDPAGKNPLYNAYVYVPIDANAPLPVFTSGVSCDTCSGAGSVAAVAVAQTGPDGRFSLNNVPYGDNVPLVVQMGKWRRKVTLPSVTQCTNNEVPPAYSRLPRNRAEGDIPRMALASGDSDPFECLLLKAGIDAEEIKPPGNGTRIDYYRFNGIDHVLGAPAGSTLTGNLNKLKEYDVVLLPCEGKENAHNTDAPNVVAYTELGGRMFTTHYGYVWLATPYPKGSANNQTSFYGTADWSRLDQWDNPDPMTAAIDQTFPKGQAFAQWLQNLGATTTLGSIRLNEPRHDARRVLGQSQRWVYGSSDNATPGVPDMLLSMTFNTPVSATPDNQCGRVVFSDFHVSADALVSGYSNSCNSDTDCGFGATCNPAVLGECSSLSCTTSSTCPSGYGCVGAGPGSCSRQACYSNGDCGSGRSCSGVTAGQCSVPCFYDSHCSGISGSTCSGETIGSCSSRSCNSNSDCGGAGTCRWGSCTSVSCTSDSDCGTRRTCQSERAGTCTNAPSCMADSTCTSIRSGATCSGRGSGTCSVGSCYTSSDCGSSGTCNNVQSGSCERSCSSNSDCSNNLACIGGKCVGCTRSWWSSNCPSGSTCSGYQASACSASGSKFPLSCRNGDLSGQEKALEFMLFDLSACVSPDSWAPPVLGVRYDPITFNLDFMAACPDDKWPVWREFDWQAQIPDTGNITFAAKTAATQSDLTAAPSAPLATATTSTTTPNWDMAIIDSTGASAFKNVDPPITSQKYLRIATTLNPTSDHKASPTLLNWEVHYDCTDLQ